MWVAFTYCYWQAYRKAINWSTKFLAVFQGTFYSTMRYVDTTPSCFDR